MHCNGCGIDKPATEFRKRKRQCRECLNGIKRGRWASDPQFRLKNLASARYKKELKKYGMDKTRATMSLIGCTATELRQHIEAQFTDGMTWANHGNGRGKWNVDHIVPCAAFDFKSEEQQNQCNHFSNLQPLWFEDNMRKGARLDWAPEVAGGVDQMLTM